MRRNLAYDDRDDVEINLSPMIDMVFILLIFFIVTTVFVEETGVEVNKPEAAAAVQLEKNSILIAVSKDNKVIYGGRDIGISGVSPIVKRLTLQEDRHPRHHSSRRRREPWRLCKGLRGGEACRREIDQLFH